MYYKELTVWKREKSGMLRKYNCFELIGEGKYCVQNMDSYYPEEPLRNSSAYEAIYLELLMEEAPEVRSGLYDTLEDAINSFDMEFGN